MKKFLTIATLVSFSAGLSIQAQQIQVESVQVKGIESSTQPTPQFEAGNVKGKNVPSPRDWLEVEVEFEAKASERGAVIPELLFRYYVAIQAEDGSTKVLTGDVNHVNIVSGEKYFSAVYVSPPSLGAITGDYRRFQEASIKAVAVEVFYNGVSKGGETSGGPTGRWWEALQPQPGVLGREKTPFALLWIDRYADVKATN
ncbi:MAG: hypothetical protein KDN20_10550 [Verrucomicrobiae bacterium]|nr:hypothetical protein [Verrucomicrobiae bacterium]